MQKNLLFAIHHSKIFHIPCLLFLLSASPAAGEGTDVTSLLTLTLRPSIGLVSDDWYPAGGGFQPDFRPFYTYESIPTFFSLDWRTSLGPFFTRLDLPLRKSFLAAYPGILPGINIPLDKGMDLDTTFPFRGSVGFRSEHFGLKLSRDELKIGNGEWSSVTINGMAPYFDYIQGYYDIGFFKATETIISMNPYLVTQEERNRQDTVAFFHNWDPTSFRERVKTAAVHELSFDLGAFEFGLGEILIIGGRSLQLQDFNPFLVYHNFYGEDWGNVIAFLNAAVTPFEGLRFYADFALDDVTAPVETKATDAPPPAFGVLAGASWDLKATPETQFRFVAEAAYVAPTFGLRGKPLQAPYSRIMYLENTVGGMRVWIDYPLCYYLGNDLFDLRFRASYRLPAPGSLQFSGYAGYHFLAKGEETLHSDLANEGKGIHIGFFPRGTVEYSNILEGKIALKILPELEAGVDGTLAFLMNKAHNAGSNGISWTMNVFVTYRIGPEQE